MKDMPNREYPHLDNATAFPGLGDPYAQYSQTFDYTKWKPGVVFRLFNVAWNERNIVDFETEVRRDEWFDANASKTTTFNSMLQLQPDGTVKLPLPFEALSRYNYMTVTFPVEPVTPNSDDRITTWCYYIRQVSQTAPSTTTLMLEMDPWQTFGYHVRFSSIQLERGHAPMAAISVDDYLSNPVANNGMLLAPDVSYGDPAAIVTHSEFHPFGAGGKIVLFATTMDIGMLATLEANKAVDWNGQSTKPSYKDTKDRWGHQYEVDGYDWHVGAADYSKLVTPVNPFGGDYAPTGLHVYAVEYADAAGLFRQIVSDTPQLMQTIQGMWVVGDDMVELRDEIEFLGFRMHTVEPVHELDKPLNLNKADFAYDEKYADIAKLYTYPYAALTLSDNDGTTCTVRVENTGSMQIHMRTCMVYPYLKAQAFLTGVNGESGTTYEWRDINGNAEKHTAWNTPFNEFMTKFDIPVYALYMDGITDWALHNQKAAIQAERLKALNAYHTGMRNTNTAYENGKDNANTAYTNNVNSANTAQTNANDTADTAYGNGKRVADSAKTNADRSTNTVKANADRSADTNNTNAVASANTAKTNADTSANTSYSNTGASLQTQYANGARDNDWTNNTYPKEKLHDYTIGKVVPLQTKYNEDVTRLEVESEQWNLSNTYTYQSAVNTNLNDFMDKSVITGLLSAAMTTVMSGAIGLAGAEAAAGVGMASSPFAGSGAHAAIPVGGSVHKAQISAAGQMASLGASIADPLAMQNQKTLNADNLKSLTDNNDRINEKFYDGETGLKWRSNLRTNRYVTASANAQQTFTESVADANHERVDKNITATKDTGDANNTRTLNAALGNNSRTNATGVANANRSMSTAKTNNAATNSTTLANNELNWEVQCGKPGDASDGGNLGRSQHLAKNNAQRTRDVTVANAGRSKDTTLNNALESRESTEFANKTALEQAQDLTELSYGQHATDAPVKYGDNSGEAEPDMFRYRGVQVRVLTQNKGQIALAGDQMLRYGYAYNGAWTVEHLQVMRHFTYWKCGEVWITADSSIMEDARAAIRNMLINGVTVWSKPEEIGAVSLYDNWKE